MKWANPDGSMSDELLAALRCPPDLAPLLKYRQFADAETTTQQEDGPMMIGNNELHLNEATMKVALQHWLNSVMVNPPTVASVGMTDGHSKTFIVKLEEAPSKEQPK
jgi:hypothetical protein